MFSGYGVPESVEEVAVFSCGYKTLPRAARKVAPTQRCHQKTMYMYCMDLRMICLGAYSRMPAMGIEAPRVKHVLLPETPQMKTPDESL